MQPGPLVGDVVKFCGSRTEKQVSCIGQGARHRDLLADLGDVRLAGVTPGCAVARGLENDHYQIDFIKDGPTEMWNLCRLCHWHHHLKTHAGYAITGGPGGWEWSAPLSETNPVLTA